MPLGSLGSCSSLGVAIRLRAHAVGPHPSSGRIRAAARVSICPRALPRASRRPHQLVCHCRPPTLLFWGGSRSSPSPTALLGAIPHAGPPFGRAETTISHAPCTTHRVPRKLCQGLPCVRNCVACSVYRSRTLVGPVFGRVVHVVLVLWAHSRCSPSRRALLPTVKRAAESVSALKMTRGTQRDALRTLACQRGRTVAHVRCACASMRIYRCGMQAPCVGLPGRAGARDHCHGL